jgi:alanyl-tRNA synthetase
MDDAAKTRGLVNSVCAALKAKPADLDEKLNAQLDEVKNLKKTVEQYKAKEAAGAVDQMLAGSTPVGAVKVLTVNVPDADAGKLRQMGDVLRDKDASVVAVLASVNGEKLTFLAVCGKDAVKAGVKAGDIVKHVCTICGGSGGGKPDSAMGGGKDPAKVDNALALVDEFVASKLN